MDKAKPTAYGSREDLFYSISCGVVQFRLYEDETVCIDNMNPEAARIFGTEPGVGVMYASTLREIFNAEGEEQIAGIKDFLTRGYGKVTFEYPIIRKSNKRIWITGVLQSLGAGEDERGKLWYEQVSFMDISASKNAMEKAEELEKTVKREKEKHESFFLDVLHQLYEPDELEKGVEGALALIGKYLKADRVCIYEDAELGDRCCATHEWCAKGVASVKEERKSLPFKADTMQEIMGEAGIRFCKDAVVLQGDTYKFLVEQGTRSVFLCGIKDESQKMCGYISVESCREVREDWSDDSGDMIVLASRLLAGYVSKVHNQRYTRLYRKRLRESEKTLDTQTSVITALGSVYLGVFHCDLKENTISIASGAAKDCPNSKNPQNLNTTLKNFVEQQVAELYRDEMESFLDLGTLPGRLKKGTMLSHDYQSIRGHWLRASVIPSGEALLLAFSYIEDERKQEREYQRQLKAIRRRESLQLKTIMEAIPGGFKIAADDPNFTQEYMSPRLIEMLGYSQEEENEVLNSHITRFIHPEDRQRVKATVLEQLEIGSNLYLKYRMLRKDNSSFWVEDIGYKVYFEDGESKFYSVILDIDAAEEDAIALKKANETIDSERRKYRDALTQNALYYYQFDVTEGILTEDIVNVEGFNYMEVMGIKAPIPYDEFCRKIYAARKMDMPDTEEYLPVTCKGLISLYEAGQTNVENELHDWLDNQYFRINTLLSKDKVTGHIIAFVLCTDITKTRREEELAKKALKEAYEAANFANHAKTDFLSKMSHDIRTPMNAIIGMTDIAKAHIDDKERVKDSLNKITMSSRHLLGLINDVLDMSKIESGKLNIKEEKFNLPELLNGLLAMTNSGIEEHHHNLNVRIVDVEHENVIGDSLRLEQVFINILNNAIKYTPDGGNIEIVVQEKKAGQPDVGYFEFSFKDNGIGMTQEFLDVLFEPFSREEDDRINRIQGTGLGMAIAKNIMHMMNGDIRVTSEVGKGTEFVVSLYLKLSHQEVEDVRNLQGFPILVADDDVISCETICDMLERLGLKSTYVTSGKEAVERADAVHRLGEDYYAIILDWLMPDLDGLTTAKEIQKRVGKTVPIVILSAYDWSDVEAEARQAGISLFISKPVFKTGLMKVLKQIQEGNKQQEKKAEKKKNLRFDGKRILVVEDNNLNREIITEILKLRGLQIEEAVNGKEAVEQFENHPAGYYDMILMDIQMPVMNGHEATRKLRTLEREDAGKIPIIAMTANAFAEDVEAARQAGMNEHMSKPINMRHLMDILQRYLS